jgi:transcriptional regulator with XRE-family HTH domain
MIFGNRIRELREEKGLLLRQLASLLEVDTATISKIERGTRRAKKEQLQVFSSVLDINQKELETLWLADKLYEIVEDENDLGLSALKVAENEFKYQTKIKG